MSQDFVTSVNDFGKQAVETVRALGAINQEFVEQVFAQQLDAASLWVEGGVKQLKVAQDSKDARDFMTQQTELVQEYTDKLMAMAKTQVTLAQTTGAKYQAWFEQGVKQANGTVKTAAKKVQAAAVK